MHRQLAEDESADSQLYLALKLAEEARNESNRWKAELAVEWFIESAKNGNKVAVKSLEDCLNTKTGITDLNKRRVLGCLSRSETEIKSEALSRTIMTTISDFISTSRDQISQSRFKHRLRRMTQREVVATKDKPASDEQMETAISQNELTHNIEQIIHDTKPSIDLTDDLDCNNLFTLCFRMLRNSFEIVDYIVVISLFVVFSLSLAFDYIFFRPNVRVLYQNLFHWKTIGLCLQLIQVLSFARIMYVINGFTNYKLWVKVLRMIDHEFPNEQTKYLKKTLKSVVVFVFVLTLELNLMPTESQPRCQPTLMSSLVRPSMALFSLLTLIRHNISFAQIFFAVIHFLSRLYWHELKPFIANWNYSADYSLMTSIAVIVLTTKTILNYVSLNLVIIPSLLVHIMIAFTDFTLQPLNPISAIIPLNIHLIFGAILMILILKITSNLKLFYQSLVISVIFTDFYLHFTREFNYIFYAISVVIMLFVTRRVKRIQALIGIKDNTMFWSLLVAVLLVPLIYTYDRQQIGKVSAMKRLAYDHYYDNCVASDLSQDIDKQIECFDIRIGHKLTALCRIGSVKVIRVNNNFKQFVDFATLGLNQHITTFFDFGDISLKEWRVFEYQVVFVMENNNREISVSMEHYSRDFVDKLKVNDIYEIEFFYHSFTNSEILLSAKCKTCWDVIHWNNTEYEII